MSLLAALALAGCTRSGFTSSVDAAADTQRSDQGIADLPNGDTTVADFPRLPDLATVADFPAQPDLPSGCLGDKDCDDNRACTDSTCVAGHCVHAVQTGFCLIAATCVATGVASAANKCLRCDPSKRLDGWSEADGAECDDGLGCTYADKCNKGSCQGTVYACSSAQSCTVGACNGSGPAPAGCDFTLAPGYCRIADTCYADGAQNPTNPCEHCDTSQSTGSWSTVAGGCVTTLAGDGTPGGTNGALSQARFDYPYGLAAGAAGKLYVADEQGHRIRLIDGAVVSTLAGTGSAGFLDGPASGAKFSQPRGIGVHAPNGDIFVADTFNHRLRLISGGQVTTYAGDGTAGLVDGPLAVAQFKEPKGVISDGVSTIYVADTKNQVIRSISGGVVSTLAGDGTIGFADGAAATARFSDPRSLALGNDGSLYIVDTNNHRIRKLDNLGQVSTVAGSSSGFADGPAAAAKFSFPYAIVVDSAQTLYVVERGNHRLRMIKAGMVSTLAGSGNAGFVDGPAATAKFNEPKGLALGSNGQIYISDHGNHAIRVYTP